MKWIIDTDHSSNAKRTLEILIKNKLDIIAITTVTNIEKTRPFDIKNQIEKDLASLNVNIPIYMGASQPYIDYVEELNDSPLVNPYSCSEESIPISKEDIPKVKVMETAAMKIIELANTHKKDLRILTLGALTNLSLAVLLDNSISDKFDKLIIVGSSYTGKHNSGVCSEANFRCDPVAAKNVILYYKNVLLIPFELELEYFEAKKSNFGSQTEYAVKMLEQKKNLLHFLATAIVLNEKAIKNVTTYPADVDIVGKYTRGCLAMEKYFWINSGTFNDTSFVDKLDNDVVEEFLAKL